VHQLEIKVLGIVDARCNHEVYIISYLLVNHCNGYLLAI